MAHSTKCSNHGHCCQNFSVDMEFVCKTIKGGEIKMTITGGICGFLDKKTNLCKIYDDRPLLCATWYCYHCNQIESMKND